MENLSSPSLLATLPCRPGICATTMEAAGVSFSEQPEPGSIAIPYHDIHGDKTGFIRWRLPQERANGKKYHQPEMSGTRAYIPPQFHTMPPGGDVVLVEGEFKALALIDTGIKAIGLPSFNTYADGKLLPGLLEAIAYTKAERVFFLGDSDTATNFQFSRSALFLAKAIAPLEVLLPRLPLNGPKGIDDLKAELGDGFPQTWQALAISAEGIDPKSEAGALAVRLLRREVDSLKAITGAEGDKQKRRIVTMAAHCREPLAGDEIAGIACEIYGFTMTAFRDAVEIEREKMRELLPVQTVTTTAKAEGVTFTLPAHGVSITDAAKEIFGVIAPTQTLFMRGGRVVEMTKTDQGTALDLVSASAFRSRIEKHGKVTVRVSYNGKIATLEKTCPAETAQALLDSTEAREYLPPIASVVACPMLVAEGDGTRVLGPGYHRNSGGILVVGGAMPVSIGPEQAKTDLLHLLDEFAFVTKADRSRAVASLLTPALRLGGFITGNIPVDVAEANKSQSGKTYRQQILAAIYNEKPHVITQRNGGVGSTDESLSQALLNGRPFIQYDNARGRIDSQCLEALITTNGPFPVRVPHKGEMIVDATRFIVLLTSNGVETTPDLANRSNIIRVTKREGYTFTTYREGDLLAHVRANQPLYLGAVFAIVREWVAKGKPRTNDTRHSFREWAQSCDWIVQNLLDLPPLMDGHQTAQERVSNPNQTWLRKLSLAIEGEGRLGESFNASALVEVCQNHDLGIGAMRQIRDEERGAKQVGIILKQLFGSEDKDRLTIDALEVERKIDLVDRGGGKGTRQEKTYVFTRSHQPPQPHQPI